MHLLSWFAVLCYVVAFAAAYGAQTGEFYEYEDQISMENRQAAVETIAMPEDKTTPSSNDQDKIDVIKQKMHMRRNGLAARNKHPEAPVTSDDLAEVLSPPSNFRAPLPRTSSSQSRSTTENSTTTTTTTAVPQIDTDNQPKVRRTRPKSNRLRNTTTTTVPTTTTEEVTTAAVTEGVTEAAVAEPQPPAALKENNSDVPYEGPVDLAPLFRDSVRRFEDEPEHSRETLNFRKQPAARESPVFTSGHAEAFEAPSNESIDGVPVYRTQDEPSEKPFTTTAAVDAEPTEVEVMATEANDTDSTPVVDEVNDEEIPDDEEEDHVDTEGERRSDESEGSSHFQRRLLDMMVSETKHMLTAVMPGHPALATFKYFPLFEPNIQSRSFNERPPYGYTSQHRPSRPRPRPLLKLSPLNPILNPHILTRPHKVNRRPPPPHSNGRPQINHAHGQHEYEHDDIPEKPSNFEPYEPFSVNFYPTYQPDNQKGNVPNSYKPVEYPKETKYEKPGYSSPKPPTQYLKEPEYPKAPEYEKPYPKPPQEYPKAPEYEKAYPKPTQEYPKAPTYEAAYPPTQYEKPLVPQYPKETEYKPASPPAPQYEKPYEKPSVPQYPKEPTHEPAYPPVTKYEKPYEKPTPQYPKEPMHESAYPPMPQYEKLYEKPAPQYPKEPTHVPTYPPAPQYEKPYEKPSAPQYPKEPTYEPAYPPAPKYEKPYEKPAPQYPKEPAHEPAYPPAPQYESSSASPAQYEEPYEKPKSPQYPKEPTYEPAYPQAPKYEKPYENSAPQYPKEPTYAPVYAQAPQYEKPYPKPAVSQYPKVPTYETSSPAPHYSKEPTYTSPAPYSTTTTKYPQYSYSSPAPAQYPQDSYYSSSQPPVSSPVPYVKPIVAYKKPTPPPIYYVSSPAAPAPYHDAYKEPASQYPVSSTPAHAYSTTTVPTPYQEYPPQSDWEPKNLKYAPSQQYPQEQYYAPEEEQYYPPQPDQYSYKKSAQQKVSASRTPHGNGTLQGQPPTQNQPDQGNTPLALDETPFEQLDRTQENQGQESEHYSVSTASPMTYTTKKRHPYERTRTRTTTARPSTYFPHRIPSMGFEGQNWDMEDITAAKFPTFKTSSFFQDAPWPHRDSFISPNGGSQRRPTKAKGTKKGGNTQKSSEAVNIETSGRSALKAEEILSLVPELPANEQSNQHENQDQQAEGTVTCLMFTCSPTSHDVGELSPTVTDSKDAQDINKNVPGNDDDPWREPAVNIPAATRRKETRTRPRVQKRRITNKQTQTD